MKGKKKFETVIEKNEKKRKKERRAELKTRKKKE
jgi:hypothetical protein